MLHRSGNPLIAAQSFLVLEVKCCGKAHHPYIGPADPTMAFEIRSTL
jgi:hypothetical protein